MERGAGLRLPLLTVKSREYLPGEEPLVGRGVGF